MLTCHVHSRSTSGILYAMKSPSVQGIKIGRTAGCPHKRAKDLSTTGVPTPFVVLYASHQIKNTHAAEKKVFEELGPCRISPQREFFSVGIKEAVEAIKKADKTIEALFTELKITARHPNKESTPGTSGQPRKEHMRLVKSAPQNTSC